MQRQVYSIAAMAMAFATSSSAQSSSVNPLNQFISIAGSAVTAVESHVATQTPASTSTSPTSTTASSTSPTSAASSTAAAAAAAAAPAYNNNLNIIIPIVVIVGLLLLAALALCLFCCLRRRRRNRRAATPVEEEEVSNWRKSNQPGQSYSPVHGSSQVPMSQQPSVPLMAAAHHEHNHPAYRAENRPENPFVPVPPQPRKTAPNARAGLTDGTVPGAPAFIEEPHYNGGRLRKSNSFSRNRSSSGVSDLSYHNGYGNNGHNNTFGIYPVPISGRGNGNGNGNGIPAYNRDSYNNGHSPVRKPVPVSTAQPTYPGLTTSTGLNSNPHNSPDGPYAAIARSRQSSVDSRMDHSFSAVPTTGGPNPDPTPYPITTSWPSQSAYPATAHAVSARRRSQSPYRSVGSPLHAQHLSQLSASPPSTDLHYTDRDVPAPIHPGTFETVPAPGVMAEIPHPTPAQARRTAQRPGFSTPPLMPSRSPNRRSTFGDSTYESGPSHQGSYGSASGDSGMQPPLAPWEDRERRYSGGSAGRKYSGSPRGSAYGTPPGGTPTAGRRLRFSDLPMEEREEGGWRVNRGVGEAL